MFHRQFIRIPGRCYATQAAPKGKSSKHTSLKKQDAKITTLPNGLVIASLENYTPVSQVSVLFKAGPRYEKGKTIGVNHTLRNAAGLTTKNASVFGITRNVEQLGGSLRCTSTREHISYSLECVRSEIELGIKFLSSVSTRQVFKPWELKDYQYRTTLDLAGLQQCPATQAIENLHKAAFRTGLGNSLYAPSYAVGSHSTDMLRQFVSQHFTTNRMAVVGVGVDHESLVGYVDSQFKVESGAGPESPASKYSGGEVRVETDSGLVYAAVATEGVGIGKTQEAFALGVLQQIIGVGPQVKRGSGPSSKLTQALLKVTENPHAVSSLNVNYSDSGLFGFFIAGQAEDMGKLLKAAVGLLSSTTKSGAITEKDVQLGKHKLRAALHMSVESNSNLAEELGVRALVTKEAATPGEVDKLIDAVTVADVTNVAKKVLNGKPSMAAVGDLTHTPYLDQLV